MSSGEDWPGRARAVAGRLPVEPDASGTLTQAGAEAGVLAGVWAVACSGGADSLSLLLALAGSEAGFAEAGRLHVLHFNHQSRGADSDVDAAFVAEVADGLGVPLHTGAWADWAGADASAAAASEARLRAARRAFFAERLVALGATVMLTGHQRDDIAETLLMRLARGAGLEGLAAPQACARAPGGWWVLRPWLERPKAELVGVLEDCGVPWRGDASNASERFFRNRVRVRVLPAWREAAGERDALAGAARSRRLLAEDAEALEAWRLSAIEEGGYSPEEPLDFGRLGHAPAGLCRRLLRWWAWARSTPLTLERAVEDALVAAVAAGGEGTFEVGPARRLRLEGGVVWLETTDAPVVEEPPWEPLTLAVGAEAAVEGCFRLACAEVKLDYVLRKGILRGQVDEASGVFLDAGAVGGEALIEVRPWRAGDRYTPLNAPGSRKLQDLFVDRKVPAGERRRLPVVCIAGEPVWAPGLPPAHGLRIHEGSRMALRLTYHPS